jgi:hypothetical protein
MRKTLFMVVLAAALVVCGPSYVLAIDDLESVDIDPGDCETDFESEQFDFEPANAHVVANQRWVIAECHVKLSRTQLGLIGGPVTQAQHYWGFECLVETEGTAEDIPAFASHAVLTPSGVLNVVCVADFMPGTNPDD